MFLDINESQLPAYQLIHCLISCKNKSVQKTILKQISNEKLLEMFPNAALFDALLDHPEFRSSDAATETIQKILASIELENLKPSFQELISLGKQLGKSYFLYLLDPKYIKTVKDLETVLSECSVYRQKERLQIIDAIEKLGFEHIKSLSPHQNDIQSFVTWLYKQFSLEGRLLNDEHRYKEYCREFFEWIIKNNFIKYINNYATLISVLQAFPKEYHIELTHLLLNAGNAHIISSFSDLQSLRQKINSDDFYEIFPFEKHIELLGKELKKDLV
jgi:hypothetical protein